MATVNTISAQEFHKTLENGDPRAQLIDVRTPAEYREVHAAAARSLPLDQLDPRELLESRNGSRDEPLYFICKSGSRAATACEKLQAAGFANVYSIEGGTEAWVRAGLPVERSGKKAISLERQVRIAAGSLVLIGLVLGWFLHPAFLVLSAFIGAGLLFAGVTDYCGMGMMLAKMPWNR